MRHKEYEIKDQSTIRKILESAQVFRLGLSFEDIPYIVPLNFVYRNETNSIFIHSALCGKKIDIMRQNNLICFEIDEPLKVMKSSVPCNFSYLYKSVIGHGNAHFIEGNQEKVAALNLLMKKYGSPTLECSFTENSINNVSVIQIIITEITGKTNLKEGEL
jgi:nitroimidazol reductase NimA-like FMN-containing flavoprotein (pyridoxamine 5'-phosphate oxidase superfamily)